MNLNIKPTFKGVGATRRLLWAGAQKAKLVIWTQIDLMVDDEIAVAIALWCDSTRDAWRMGPATLSLGCHKIVDGHAGI